jgi:hypothetical protein
VWILIISTAPLFAQAQPDDPAKLKGDASSARHRTRPAASPSESCSFGVARASSARTFREYIEAQKRLPERAWKPAAYNTAVHDCSTDEEQLATIQSLGRRQA